MATQEETLELKNGPCEMDFFYALARQQSVHYLTETGDWINVTMLGIEAEDDSRKRWNFSGCLNGNWGQHESGSKIKGFFNYAEGRIGWLRILG